MERNTAAVVACAAVLAVGLVVPADGMASVKAISAGAWATCAVRDDGTAACWGINTSGKNTVPIALGAVKAISAGVAHTCAIKTDDTAVCVVWCAKAQADATTCRMHARRVSPTGRRRADRIISDASSLLGAPPSVSASGPGLVWIAWTNHDPASNRDTLLARRITATGALSATRTLLDRAGSGLRAGVVTAPSGGATIVWQQADSDLMAVDITAAADTGTPVVISATARNWDPYHTIATGPTGNVAVVYQSALGTILTRTVTHSGLLTRERQLDG